jgi:hypothetical protein
VLPYIDTRFIRCGVGVGRGTEKTEKRGNEIDNVEKRYSSVDIPLQKFNQQQRAFD